MTAEQEKAVVQRLKALAGEGEAFFGGHVGLQRDESSRRL